MEQPVEQRAEQRVEQPVAVNSSRPGEQRAGCHSGHNDDHDVLPASLACVQQGGGGGGGAGRARGSLSPPRERPGPAQTVQTEPPPQPEPDCDCGQQVGHIAQPAPRPPRPSPPPHRGDDGPAAPAAPAAPLPPAGSPAGQSAQGCHIGHIAGGEDGGDANGAADARARGRLPASRTATGGLLNAIEARLGDAIWDAFPLYLRAIGITVQMGRSVEETKRLMARHLRGNGLQRHGVPDDGGGGDPGDGPTPCWEIIRSPLGGRGVIATRDLRPGDLVLVDAPLMLGPRAGSDPSTPAVCVGCLQGRRAEALRACSRGCRLPVCARDAALPACEDAACHAAECALLRRWGVKGDAGRWSEALLRAASAVRCLGLPPDQREILASMQSHHGRQHASEVTPASAWPGTPSLYDHLGARPEKQSVCPAGRRPAGVPGEHPQAGGGALHAAGLLRDGRQRLQDDAARRRGRGRRGRQARGRRPHRRGQR